MLKASHIKQDYDRDLLSLSSMIIRQTRDHTDDGETIYYPELQFEIRNISNNDLAGLSAEIKYYDSSDEFLGLDSDLRVENLPANDVEAFSLFIEAPDNVSRAELKIKAKPYGLGEKVRAVFHHPIALGLLFGPLIYSNVKG
jgi:hypothetical protein